MKVGNAVFIPVNEDDATVGRKDDLGKPKMSLLSQRRALEEVTRVLEFGAERYGKENWRHVAPERYEDAITRHVLDYNGQRGEGVLNPRDADSGYLTLAHLVCDALFVLEMRLKAIETEKEDNDE